MREKRIDIHNYENRLHRATRFLKNHPSMQQAVMDALCRHGFEYTWSVVSDTCEFAGRTRGPRVISKGVVKSVLEETQGGESAKDWLKEFQAGMKKISALHKAGKDSELERVGRDVRALTKIE